MGSWRPWACPAAAVVCMGGVDMMPSQREWSEGIGGEQAQGHNLECLGSEREAEGPRQGKPRVQR